MSSNVNETQLIDLYGNLCLMEDKSNLTFFINGNLILDPNECFYINLDSNTTSFKDNIEEVLWRINGRDDIHTLPDNSFLRKYAINEESKIELLNKINKEFNNKDSEVYKEFKDELDLDNLVGKISPLYSYTRAIARTKTASVFYHSLPLPYDKEINLLSHLEQDKEFLEKNDTEKKELINRIIQNNNGLFHDQLGTIFFSLQNKIFMDNPGQYVLYCIDPTIRSLITDSELQYARNIFNNSHPFLQTLDSIQFIPVNNRINIKMNFNNFYLFNMFDVFYGLVLLLLANHVYGSKELGKIYISSSLYTVRDSDVEYYKSFDINKIDKYKASFNPGESFKDFSVTKPHQYSFTRL